MRSYPNINNYNEFDKFIERLIVYLSEHEIACNENINVNNLDKFCKLIKFLGIANNNPYPLTEARVIYLNFNCYCYKKPNN